MTLVNALVGVAAGMSGPYALTSVVHLNSAAPTLALMLGLAVGIDYSLFITSRYRQFLAEGLDSREAAGRAVGTAGSAVVFAGVTVTAGFLLTVGGTFGITMAVFQEGHLAGLIGVDTPGPLISFLPVLLIGILFGLAMDYEVFLVSRMHEDFVHGDTARQATINGLGHNRPLDRALPNLDIEGESLPDAPVPQRSGTTPPVRV